MSNRTLLAALGALLLSAPSLAEDARQLAPLPEPAVAVLRQEMLDNMLALNEILTLLAENKVTEAGVVAEARLGVTAMGKNRALPLDARPGAHMPLPMHELGIAGHKAASEFARVAATGDRDLALAQLPALTSTCVACHAAYRIR